MQRLFTHFPDRWPGVALLLWRVSLAAVLAYGAVFAQAAAACWQAPAWLCAALLAAGLLTPLAAVGAMAVEATSLARQPDFTQALALVACVATVMAGPGAYSIDARLFGRRLLVWRSRR